MRHHASLGWHLGIVCGEQNGITLGELPAKGFVGGGWRGLLYSELSVAWGIGKR